MARLEYQETVKNSEMESVDDNNNSGRNASAPEEGEDSGKTSVSASGKYQLRPRSAQARRLCLESDWSFCESTRPKPRSAPLSRYRRKTANARERYRMRQINTAFESLRGVLPSWVCSRRAAAEMTKIATLRLASAYIRSLQDILDGSAPEDTCAWGLASILDSPPSPQKPNVLTHQPPSGHLHHDANQNDLVSLLTGASPHQGLHHTLDGYCYAEPINHTDEFLLGCEPSMVSSEA